jgi:hypothetical protein
MNQIHRYVPRQRAVWLVLILACDCIAQGIPFSSDALVYYSFTGNAQNQAGSSYHLTVSGPSLSADRFGSPNSAYRFDGVDDYLVSSQALPDSAEFTLAAWIRPEIDVAGAIFYDAQFFTPGEDLILNVQSGGKLFGIADKGPTIGGSVDGSVAASNVIRAGVWQHVAMTARTGLIALFVNGALVASNSVGGNNVGFHSVFYIGAENHGLGPANFFRGSIDEFVLYRRALSTAEIAVLANTGSASSVPPTITLQPASISAAVGGGAAFNVVASGTSQLSYQWRKDGISLPGATASTLSLANVQPWHIGDYSATVFQSAGSITSSPAALTVSGISPGIWRNLVAYYPFDGSANDRTPFANNATPAGTFQYLASGITGGALRITGDNSLFYSGGGHVILPRFDTYMNSGFTISLWTKDEVLGGQPVNEEQYVSFGALDLPKTEIILNSVTRAVRFNIDNGQPGGGREISQPLGPSDYATWKHLTLTYSPGKMAAYYNGAKIGETSVTYNVFPVATAALSRHWWNAGASSSARMSVTYDNVRVYSRGLTDSDVQQLYASEAPTVAPAISVQPTAQTIVEGESLSLSVTTAGSAPFTYQWRRNDTAIPGAINATLTISSVQASDAGNYAVTITNVAGSITTAAVLVTVNPANPGRLANLSIRTASTTGGGTLIVGFVLGGRSTSGNSSLLTRASGPALQQFGIAGILPDPVLSLYDGARLVASNDNWSGADVATNASAVGAFAFPGGSKDSALMSSLAGSSYTAQVLDASSSTGIALVELYDTSTTFSHTRPRLVNVSARATAGTGDLTMIAGFVVKGDTAVTVLLRAVGPTLSQFGVSGTLANPRLTLVRDTTLITVNDNWGDLGATTISATAASVGAFALPANSLDSAILATLQPGAYTVQVSGANNTPGVALIEIYEVP